MDYDIPEEVRTKYIERRRLDLMTCKDALKQLEFKIISHLGHQIQGNAAMYGFAGLGEIAVDLEYYANKKELENLNLALGRFEKFLTELKTKS